MSRRVVPRGWPPASSAASEARAGLRLEPASSVRRDADSFGPELQQEFRQLAARLGKTIVFVTHDVREALLLGTRIALLAGGKLVAVHPAKQFLRGTEAEVKEFVRALGAGDAALDPKPETENP